MRNRSDRSERELLQRALEANDALVAALEAWDEVTSKLPAGLQGRLRLRSPHDLEQDDANLSPETTRWIEWANSLEYELVAEAVKASLEEHTKALHNKLASVELKLISELRNP